MKISLEKFSLPRDQDRLVTFLTAGEWPFHGNANLSAGTVLRLVSEGIFDGTNHESFWIFDDAGREAGFLRIFDLDDVEDGYPLFDLRIREGSRGKGLGTAAVRWLTEYLFGKFPNLDRIAGTTRADNATMRKIFRACGYAKEGHFRKDWPAGSGGVFDTVKYGILREDWLSGVTTPVPWNDEP